MSIAAVTKELAEVNAAIAPLAQRRDGLNRELQRLKSLAFIDANSVTLDEIELSDGDDKPDFGIICTFGEWMRRTGCRKRFCEWNGAIYFTAEVMAGRMDPNAPGRVEDVPKARAAT